MRSDKKAVGQSSGQSTDSEHTGNGSSGSSSSSLGDSATAAARVLAAWQDRALPTGSIASGATVSAGISADDSAIWTAARVHSSTSTPRHAASSFDPHTREGSAPVPGSLEAAANRRTDMGFLALLNSAAAFVAESSVSPQKQQQQQQTQQTQQHHTVDNPYLTLSSINNGYGQAAVDAAVAAEQGDYSAHYNPTLSSAAYHSLTQALQSFTATSLSADDGGGSGMLPASATESRGPGPFDYASASSRINTRSVSAIRPDQIMTVKSEWPEVPVDQSAASSVPKRKRKEPGAAESTQTPTKRKVSHTPAYPSGETTTPPVPPHSAEARRAARKWSEEETDNLLQGCTKYGVGAWKKILDDPAFVFNNRTSVDLKDRFRTIRAQDHVRQWQWQ
ncbi:hypothetical protein GGI21_004325 [Coemansia aciculifera]|nr:hypothetical protein GGI21_004325 [Coemansia aciculifera]